MKLAALSPGPALRRLPISLRLGATFAVLFLVVLATLSSVAYWGLGRSLRSEIDRSLVTAVNTRTLPSVNAWVAARYTLPGIVAHESARQGGVRLDIPDFGDAPEA